MGEFDHGISDNKYNKHAWILGKPEIGEGVWIGAFCLIDALYSSLKIGKGSNISSGAQVLTHSTVRRCISERNYPNIEARATEIGDFCFIGSNAVVLMGVSLGHHSVVAAGAVVPQDMQVPPYSMVAGVPAKIIGSSKKYLKYEDGDSISVTIPAFNEEETLEGVVNEAVKELERLKLDYEIVLVNDGSTDKTGEVMERLKGKRIRAIHHSKNKGFTGAITSCYRNAKKSMIFLAPADGQFDFSELASFIKKIKDVDVAVGYRIDNPENIVRKFNSWFFHFLCRRLLGIHLKEISTVILWRKRVLDSITIESEDRSAMVEPEVIAKAIKKGYKFSEVPIHFKERRGGVPKGANPIMIVKTLQGMFRLWQKLGGLR